MLLALSAVALLGTVASSAAANRLSVSNRAIRAVFPELTMSGGGQQIICEVTMEGSFHTSTISKAPDQLIGLITRAIVNEEECTSTLGGSYGEVPGGEEINWHIWYRGYTGTLPNINALLELLNTDFLIWAAGFIPCRYEGAIDGVATTGGTRTTLRPETAEENIVPLVEGGFLCPEEGEFRGEANVTLLGTSNNIIVSLI